LCNAGLLLTGCKKQVILPKNSTLTVWHLAAFRDFQKKKRLNARDFVWEYLRSCTGYEASKDRANLLVCTRKKIFHLGVWIFCE